MSADLLSEIRGFANDTRWASANIEKALDDARERPEEDLAAARLATPLKAIGATVEDSRGAVVATCATAAIAEWIVKTANGAM